MSIGRQTEQDVIKELQKPIYTFSFGYPYGVDPWGEDYIVIRVVTYDIANPMSYVNAKAAVCGLQSNNFCVLLGQKRSDSARQVSEHDAREFARIQRIPYYEYDARDRAAVENALHHAIQEHLLNIVINDTINSLKINNCIQEKDEKNHYHSFKKTGVARTGTSQDHFRYKICLALDILGSYRGTKKDIFSSLLHAFKDEYVLEVKFCVAKNKVLLGKEADISLVHPNYLEKSKQDELDVLANHVRIMRKLDQTIKNFALPMTIEPSAADNMKELGLESGAISVVHSDEKDQAIETKDNIYVKVNKAAKKELAAIKKEIEEKEWKTGVFGGEKLFKDKGKVPAGVKVIYEELKKVDDRTALERLAVIKRLFTTSHDYEGHGCFNSRNLETQAFYDAWHTRLNKLVRSLDGAAPPASLMKYRYG